MAGEKINMMTDDESAYDFDGIWKDFVHDFWQIILRDCIPDLYDDADLEREAEFLDKEMHEISQQLDGESNAVSNSKWYVDNLLKIYLKDGREEWVLLHIEIQGRGGEMISLRMFRYSCMIFLRYGRQPVALVILTAKRPKREGEPGVYRSAMFGTKTEYSYNTLMAYDFSDEELLANDSPVHLFIYAVKIASKYRRSDEKKFEYMRKILKVLVERNWDIGTRRKFVMFLEYAMRLRNREYKVQFMEESTEALEGKKVRYKPIREELREEFFKEGREEGRAEMIRSFICSGFLTDEQIAIVTKQSPEDVAALRHEIEGAR